MNSVEATEFVAQTLDRLGVPFLVVGSFSSNVYTAPRATLDADFVIAPDAPLGDIREALEPHFRMDPQIGFETKLMTTKYVFEARDTAFRIELFLLSDDSHDRWRFERRIERRRGDTVLYFPHAEDVIIQKLRWGREKDRLDIKEIIKARLNDLDWGELEKWTQLHGTHGQLKVIVEAATQEIRGRTGDG